MPVVHTLRRLTREVAERSVQGYIVRPCLRKQEGQRGEEGKEGGGREGRGGTELGMECEGTVLGHF